MKPAAVYAKSAAWLQIRERGNMPLLRLIAWISLTLGRRAGRVLLHLTTGYFVLTSFAMRRAQDRHATRA